MLWLILFIVLRALFLPFNFYPNALLSTYFELATHRCNPYLHRHFYLPSANPMLSRNASLQRPPYLGQDMFLFLIYCRFCLCGFRMSGTLCEFTCTNHSTRSRKGTRHNLSQIFTPGYITRKRFSFTHSLCPVRILFFFSFFPLLEFVTRVSNSPCSCGMDMGTN